MSKPTHHATLANIKDQQSAPKLLRINEVSEALAIGRNMVYKLMSDGDIRYIRIGADRRILQSEVARFIAARLDGSK